MRLKIIENFDSSFTLLPEARTTLFALLNGEVFLKQVAQEAKCQEVEFLEKIFQPVPYSSATPKGMPQDFEQYSTADEYLIINVPPNFMFSAKIAQPSRLCAVYRKKS